MATSASAPQQLDASSSLYHSAVPEYYASYPQGYQQVPAYSQPSWPPQQSMHTAAHTYPAQAAEPSAQGTGLQPEVANPSFAQQAQHDLNSSYYSSQQYHDWYNHYVQYYGQYPADQPAPQYGYAAAAAAPQASAAPWVPAASVQPVMLPAPAQQAPPAPAAASQYSAAPRPAAQQHPRPKAKAAAMPGYISMPDGSFKVVPKEGRPAYIAPNVPKKRAGAAAADARPAFIQVQDKKPESKEAGAMPAALTRFVQACFTAADATTDKAAMMTDIGKALQERVKTMIKDSQAKGEMWTRDWDNVPLPIMKLGACQDVHPSPSPSVSGRPSKWGQKPSAQPPSAARPPSPSSSLTSRSTGSSYSSDSHSRSRSRSFSPSSSRSRSSSRSPDPQRRGRRAGKRHRVAMAARGSPSSWQGKAKKFKQAGPPETKKQRKLRMAQERKAAQESAAKQKKGKKGIMVDESHVPTAEELRLRQMRAGRFGKGAVDHSVPAKAHAPVYAAQLARGNNSGTGDSEGDWDRHAVQGSCSNLEKKYFRLTGPPDPSAVRPPHVLQAALARVIRMYRAGKCDIHYAEDQLKAMRQDVTVQHVKGSLPVQIYEAHARACLEHGNGGDFNQCQTQLKVLYKEGSPGCVEEFVAYRVLYQAILRTKESASLLATLEELTPQVRAHPAVAHALRVRQALVFSQFPAFFKLYATAPNLGRALMDMCFSRVRFAALETVVDSFKGTKVKVLYVASVLGFLVKLGGEAGSEGQPAVVSEDTTVDVDTHNAEGGILLPGCAKTIYMGKHPAQTDAERAATNTIHWLQSCNAYVILDSGAQPSSALLDCKLSTGLRMPEDLAAVAHGDATLNLDNFMHQFRV